MSKTKNLIYVLSTLASGLLLFPSIVFALGFGGITVNSKLGEPLDIEVELLSITPTEIATLEVGFASRSDFARANVPYPENASLINFEIIEGLSGQYYIVLSSENPINNTFLHFLIAANWSGGKVVREYTALMDPPLYSGDTASVVELPDATAEDISSSYLDSSASSVSVVSGDTLSGIVNRLGLPDSISMFQGLTALLEANPDAFINQNMNRLRAGATLTVPTFASIARIDQRIALQNFQTQTTDYNQFLSGIGYSPDESTVSSSSAQPQATQQQESNNQVEEPVEISSVSDQTEDSVDLSGLNIETDEVDSATLRIAQQSSEEELVSAIEGEQGDDAQVSALKSQLAGLDESLLASGVENDEVKQRIKDIQAQVERVSRLIEIEDTNLAFSQDNISENNQTGSDENSPVIVEPEQTITETTTETEDDPVVAAVDTSQNNDGGSTISVDVTDSSQQANTANTNTEANTQTSNTQTASQAAVAKVDNSSQVAEAEKIEKAKNSATDNSAGNNNVARTVADTGIMANIASIFGSISDYALKILAGLVVIIAGLFFYRRRKSHQEFEESMLDIESGQISANEANQESFKRIGAASGIDLASRDSGFELTVGGGMSYLSEEGIAGVSEEENEVIQEGNVDPLAEADVYLAYDRDEQAIQVLKEAYASNPERVELAEKLLEIYHKQDERIAFDDLALELKSRIGAKHNPVWTKVLAMGREVSPDNDLYSVSPELNALSESSELELDTGPMASLPGAAEESAAKGEDTSSFLTSGEVDIELDELDLSSGSQNSAIKSLEIDDLDLDIDLEENMSEGVLDAPTLSQIITAAEVKELGSEYQDAAAEFDIDAKADDIALVVDDEGAIEFNLDDDEAPDMDITSELSGALQEIEEEKETDSDRIPEQAVEEPVEITLPNVDQMKVENAYLSELSEQSIDRKEPYHESETALELAKAYLELGEKDIAKGFIEEVINEGSDKQKAKAEELVKELV